MIQHWQTFTWSSHIVERDVTSDPQEAMEHRNWTGTNRPVGSNMTVEVVPPDEVDADESTPGVVRKTLFETETAVVVQSHIEGGTTTGWHYHGDRHVYGYIVEGTGAVEYGPDGGETRECSTGEYFYISPGTIHRDITPPDEATVVLVCFVGCGPVVVNVDGPDAD